MANNIGCLVATNSSRIRDLVIKDGQLIFLQDVGRIAFDYKGKRVFYNQIMELETEVARLTLDDPLPGYYFVINTGVLWHLGDEWTQITERPQEVVFVGVELPELGQAKTNMLYVNKAEREIAIFDSDANDYLIVSDYTNEATQDQIDGLFA